MVNKDEYIIKYRYIITHIACELLGFDDVACALSMPFFRRRSASWRCSEFHPFLALQE